MIADNANYTCEICGGQGDRHPIEAHEIWNYAVNGSTGIQVLAGLIALCPDCHHAKHYGRSAIVFKPSDLQRLNNHICTVNAFTPIAMNIMMAAAKRILNERNEVTWSQDVTRFFAEYRCASCPRTRDLRPAVAEQENGRITLVRWLCREHTEPNSARQLLAG